MHHQSVMHGHCSHPKQVGLSQVQGMQGQCLQVEQQMQHGVPSLHLNSK